MDKEKKLIEGRYEQHEILATGGLAHIYLGWDHQEFRPVAVKRLRDDLKEAIEAESLNRHEAECLRAVRHENVMGLYTTGEDEAGYYQVMELVTGPNLQQIIDSVMPAATDFVEIARQALSGLGAIHEKGVIHCDIKPDNLMITLLANGKQRIKIIDFGLARFQEQEENLGEVAKEEIFGTPEFVSPELLEGKPPTMLSDLYALGHVFYYALAGRPAFEKNTVEKILEAHLREQPEDLCRLRPDLSRDLGNWVHQFIERHPEARHMSTASALKELESLPVWADVEP
ncbi:MAG: serine/threonine protein kinase [Blastochloris sp.]|nr:serine/threonine protein kinase [Blastochloris sp.]